MTLRSAARIAGVGLHTGARATVTVHPAAPDSGIVFVAGAIDIPARWDCVVNTERATTLGRDGVTLGTVEHLLSACAGLGVDNARVAVEGPELPALDGSAREWVALLDSVGLESQDVAAQVLELTEPVRLTDGAAVLTAEPADAFAARYALDYPDTPIGHMVAEFRSDTDSYAEAIAPARTFALIEEVEALRAAGLAQGGSLDNALVVYPDRYSGPLRLPNEPARHKILDLLGDLWLLGARVRARVTVVRGGHRAHVRLAQALARAARRTDAAQSHSGVGTHGHQ